MEKKKLSTTMVTVLLISILALLPAFPAVADQSAVIFVSPQVNTFSTDTTPVGSRFNITMWVANVSGLLGWQIQMHYNSSILRSTRAWHLTWDPQYVFYGRWTILDGPAFGSDYVLIADHPIPYDRPSFNGTGKLCIIEFTIIAEPSEGGELSCILDITKTEYFSTLLLDYDINEIPAVKMNGFYDYTHPAPQLVGDLNGDGKVDTKDIALAALAFGSYPNHPRWNNQADINQDNRIDIRDIASVAIHFGETYP